MQTRIAYWAFGVAGAIVLSLLLLLYTPPGLVLVGGLVSPLTGGEVQVTGLGGFFPNHLHVARLQIADRKGTWLSVEMASLDWSALAMLRSHVSIDNVSASKITVARRPIPSGATEGPTPRIDIAHLAAPRIVIDAPVIGHAVTLSVSGSLHYASIHQLAADLLVTRLDNQDRYRVAGGITNDIARGTAEIHEGADGVLGRLANLPGLGPVNLSAQAQGDARVNTMAFQLSAGQLRAGGHGTISLAARQMDVDAILSAPAMIPSPGIRWQALSGDMHVHGAFDAPRLDAKVQLMDGGFRGAAAKTLILRLTGDSGHADLEGAAEKVTLPGSHPDLIAGAPLRLSAEADLKDKTRLVHFELSHPLMQLRGSAQTAGTISVTADLSLPSLAPFAVLAGTAMGGDANFHLQVKKDRTQIQTRLDGQVNAKGQTIPARLLGKARLAATAVFDGADLTASHIQLQGAGLNADVRGDLRGKRLNYRFVLDLRDLSRLAAAVGGTLSLHGTANGPVDNAAFSASGDAVLATQGFARQRVAIEARADGLPKLGNALLTLDGRLDDAPLTMHAVWNGGRARQAKLDARWRSFNAQAGIHLDAGNAMTGKAHLALRQLTDFAVFTGVKLSGTADAAITFSQQGGKTNAALTASVANLHGDAATLESASLKGAVRDLLGKPGMDIDLGLHKIAAQGWAGDAQGHLYGPLTGLAITLDWGLAAPDKSPLKLHAAASLDLPRKQLTLSAVTGDWHSLTLALDAPATLQFANGLAVDHLSAHLGKGRITVAGRISPQLSLTASTSGLTLTDFQAFAPQLGAQGAVSAQAELRGSPAAPVGHISLHATGLSTIFSRGLPPGAITLDAELSSDHAMVQASADAGANAHLALSGTAPLKAGGAIALHAGGKADLALLDAFLAAEGRRVRGTVTLDGDVGGTMAQPRITGHAELADGEFQDYAQGLRVHDITAGLTSDGTRLTLTQLKGQAGQGSLTAAGHVDLQAPDMPIDMQMSVTNAQPVANDLMRASLSGDLTLKGHVKTSMSLAGKIQLTGGEINLPENFPAQVAVLNVRRRGQPPPPPPPRQSRIALDISVRTTGPIFVRGHGVDAEMGGAIQVGGTVGAPVISGGLRMERGSYTIVGQTLDFTTGRIRFDGTGLRSKLDPALDFVAETVSGGVTATLTVTGYASSPKIALSSSPQLPQDEVVAHLLFQQSVKQLTPLQLASIAQAAAAMGGVGGGFNPLGAVRRTLGLDRLSVGSVQGGAGGTQNQTTVEAGRYVTRNVYVGVKQNLSGGTQTQVQVDITRRLKAQATLATGASTVTTQGNSLQDNGSSVGLSYQFEY
ncbi:MAG TPA: translocation/assembly module TamB domain-containing protein [Rhizomicrobium sp.]|nr:translocation/assembly module TamB domain-containing protein [Rhizomicrobium sp.]